eukprot:PhF_6_TR1434/c0_g1_i1/m.2533/K16742/ARL2BP, BART; ADP-ribosylation factor-like protein 2-binding protein
MANRYATTPDDDDDPTVALPPDDDDETECVFATSTGTPEDAYFDNIVGVIEELLMDDTFASLRDQFFRKHAIHFVTTTDENPHIYFDIHRQYIAEIESFVEKYITTKIPTFQMSTFLGLLQNRKEEVTGDIWDLLSAATNFLVFKESMIEYRATLVVESGAMHVEGHSPSRGRAKTKPSFEGRTPGDNQ